MRDFLSRPATLFPLAAVALLAFGGCTPTPYQPGLATQADTIGLENTDRIQRFRRLAAQLGTEAPSVDQISAPAGSVPGVNAPVPVVRVIFSERSFFPSGSATPRPEASRAMDLIAENMRRDVPDAALTLLGHTDATGSDALNTELSRRRAAAVMAGLIARGVPSSQLDTVAVGRAQPIAPNLTADGRARNRRVEFMISGSDAANLAVVMNRQINPFFFRVATARPAAPPAARVAVYKPARTAVASNETVDDEFLIQSTTLALRTPETIGPQTPNAHPLPNLRNADGAPVYDVPPDS